MSYNCAVCGNEKEQKKRFCVHGEWWCNKCHLDFIRIFGQIKPFAVETKGRNEIDGMIRSMRAVK